MFSVYVCLVDEYSSQEKCDTMARRCYQTYRQEKCVQDIKTCLLQHPSDQIICFDLAETCLTNELEVQNVCIKKIPQCFSTNTNVSGILVSFSFITDIYVL